MHRKVPGTRTRYITDPTAPPWRTIGRKIDPRIEFRALFRPPSLREEFFWCYFSCLQMCLHWCTESDMKPSRVFIQKHLIKTGCAWDLRATAHSTICTSKANNDRSDRQCNCAFHTQAGVYLFRNGLAWVYTRTSMTCITILIIVMNSLSIETFRSERHIRLWAFTLTWGGFIWLLTPPDQR